VPILRVCPDCGSEWSPDFPRDDCPDCGSALGEPAEAGSLAWEPETFGSMATNVGLGPAVVWQAGKAARGNRCPWCRGRLHKGASVCAHCGREVAEGSEIGP